MSAGQPLTDLDREPWLRIVREKSQREARERSGPVVVGCSALKGAYRDNLRGHRSDENDSKTAGTEVPTSFVFIEGSRELLLDRMSKRQGHFMKVGMLDSQLATLENPTGEPGVVVVQCEDPTEKQVAVAIEGLKRINPKLA